MRFGVGSIASLGATVREHGSRAFVVTDAGVRAAGVLDTVAGVLADDGIPTGVFAEVEPNPGGSVVERGAAALREFGLDGTVVVAVGGGSAMDTAKALSLRATNDAPVWDLGYDDPALTPGRPIVAVVTTAGTGAETNSFGVITDEAAGRKAYVGHPSLLPVATILDPALTRGAAAGRDRRERDRRDDPLARVAALGEPEPLRRGDGARRDPDGRGMAAGRGGGRQRPRVPLAAADGVASRGRRPGERHGRRPGPRARPRARDPGPAAHGTALAVVLPEVLAFYAAEPGLRDRELALVGVALGAASPVEADAVAVPRAIDAVRALCAAVDQRPTLRALGFDDAMLDVVAQDAIDDAAIGNSPRLPSFEEARAILSSVAG